MPRKLALTITSPTGVTAVVNPDGSQDVTVVAMPPITVDPPVGGATEAKQDAGNASLATLAGAVAGSEMQVDVVSMPTTVVNIPTGGGATPITVGINISSIDTHEIVAADATKRIKVLNYKIKAHGANTVTIKHGSTAFGGPNTMADGEYDGIAGSILGPVLITGVNEALNITTTSTAQLSGHLTYILE